ncbi:MAG: hypothetical protein A2015_06500 [Spirochaetes bacterium GWF1_31_7]|nr:MAG: hypothetical protein A2Y30_08335 [Spirochaetes bacterium GWE1_32_154]OHD51395.1 MAG: hypothetical protein A2Y29_14720 [Spirochaetes bacterium GWE2_31_10]OHD53121.1 MAG: hypothetical protein A2015_06500 [Spirochaetes bacterium GWF1_31_7]OHD82264.1 MAG: hypothetical protein A2355_01000 [Spirochaetes bacterium RIFOXYB1_FULL_32_8]HBD94458.1 hypothetical protein [Spirochaetia bacterium]
MIEKIKKVLIFSDIDNSLLLDQINKQRISVRTFEKGSFILHQDAEYDSLYAVINGICYSDMIDVSGKNIKIDDFQNGELIASGILFSCDNRLPVSVIAKSNCEILILDKKAILDLCMHSEGFLLDYMRLISDKVTFLTKKLLFISFKSIKSKLASFLVSKIKDDKDYISIDQSIEDLANYFGVARPSLSRVISDLELEGIIFHEKNIYTIIDKTKLFKLI